MKKFLVKTLAIILLALIAFPFKSVADEGMWLPMFVKRLNYVDMQKMGLQLTPEEMYDVNNSSLKDAIVGLSNGPTPRGFFCTGEIVSEKGLVFTNHHCAYSFIQQHSTVKADYLQEGFWAMKLDEEIPNPGLSASILVRMEDVTDDILKAITPEMTEKERSDTIRSMIKILEQNASDGGKYNPVVKPFYAGNEYYMFVYQVFKDVRLVGAPPSSIGKFGGDTDNWMWPRHTGDFAVLRIYCAPDGSPAEYSEDNVPYTPKHHLPISLKGYEKDDFTMIWGFPGTTERYMSSYGIDYNIEIFYPLIVDIFGKQLEIMDEYMAQDDAVRIMYADNHAGLANTWKNFIGQIEMLRKNKVAEKKVELENQYSKWAKNVKNKQYNEALPNLKNAYEGLSKISIPLYYANIAGIGLDIVQVAFEFQDYLKAVQSKNQEMVDAALAELKALPWENSFSDSYQPIVQKTFSEMLKLYKKNVPAEQLPSFFKLINKNYKGNIDAFTADVYKKSIFASVDRIHAFLKKPNAAKVEKDLVTIMLNSLLETNALYRSDYSKTLSIIASNDRSFIKGLREMNPDKIYYPDANSTLRMSYGSIQDYDARDAVHYDYVCTMKGIIEKEVPGDLEFDVPKRLKELYEKQDFGDYGVKIDGRKDVITCFLSTNDITGGNSGSPIMNGKGELIGLAFDGNWEAMSGDISFEPKLQRTINVDIRYVLFVIEKYAGAKNLIKELTIVK